MKLTRERTVSIEVAGLDQPILVDVRLPRSGVAVHILHHVEASGKDGAGPEEAQKTIDEAVSDLAGIVVDYVDAVRFDDDELDLDAFGFWSGLDDKMRRAALMHFEHELLWPLAFQLIKGASPSAVGKSETLLRAEASGQ